MTKKKEWTYEKSKIPRKSYYKTPKTELVHPNQALIWSYSTEAWEERVVQTGPDTCWEWDGARHRQGYGLLSVGQSDKEKANMMNAQRLAMAIELGRPILSHEQVFSTCRCNSCTNPAHLRIGQRVDIARASEYFYAREIRLPEVMEKNLNYLTTRTKYEVAAKFDLTLEQAVRVKAKAAKMKKEKFGETVKIKNPRPSTAPGVTLIDLRKKKS